MNKDTSSRIEIIIFAVLFIVLTLAFYASWIKTKNRDEAQEIATTIRLGFVEAGISGLMVRIIEDNNISKSLNLNIEFIPFNSPIALNNAIVAKEVDVAMATGANAAAKMIETGSNVKYFFPNVLNSVSLLTTKKSYIKSLDELKGKTIGWYGLQTSGGTSLYLILDELGYDFHKDFKFIEATPPLLPPLLSRGEVDAIIVFEPITTKLLTTGNYEELIGPFWKEWKNRTGAPMELSGYVAHENWLEENKYEATKLLTMWINTVDTFKANANKQLKLYSRLTGIESDEGIKLASTRLTDILVKDWGDIEGAIGDTQNLLYKKSIYFYKQPKGVIKKIEPFITQ
ncbi:ABC transporter substrate-binding protein [Teredinibacter turnerae]|uniref:ABC transporter substrate-binding protein n=1 Tax=Teredinibacter turnerae TaxID=2426 RepID=UPI0005F87DAE|nr:ABC transporter substrate-binding protein [Teredinibacter turnerae]